MTVNFKITNNSALDFKGRHIDIHNNFDFEGFDYNVPESKVILKWKKTTGDWIAECEVPGFILVHKVVTWFRVIEQDENSKYEDNKCLGDISFVPAMLRELNDILVTQEKPKDGDDILYLIENGQRIRIHCKEIELILYANVNLFGSKHWPLKSSFFETNN
jgi:hypothetical protein